MSKTRASDSPEVKKPKQVKRQPPTRKKSHCVPIISIWSAAARPEIHWKTGSVPSVNWRKVPRRRPRAARPRSYRSQRKIPITESPCPSLWAISISRSYLADTTAICTSLLARHPIRHGGVSLPRCFPGGSRGHPQPSCCAPAGQHLRGRNPYRTLRRLAGGRAAHRLDGYALPARILKQPLF